jgi:hypothetical protein
MDISLMRTAYNLLCDPATMHSRAYVVISTTKEIDANLRVFDIVFSQVLLASLGLHDLHCIIVELANFKYQ